MNTNILNPEIPPGSNFSDAFWDDEYKGVDTVTNKLKRSKKTSEEIRHLFDMRAQIEQEYGEKLLKLAVTSKVGKQEYGSFAETLSCIPTTLETTARAHIDLSRQLKDHLEVPLGEFLREQREIRKMQHVQIENLKQLRIIHQNEVSTAKECYLIESTKLMTLAPEKKKEIEEQERKTVVAEEIYKRSIDSLNSINEKWINHWKRSADTYQEMEIKGNTYLRNTLWSFSNIVATTLNVDEECCDRIRTALETTDVEKDIIDFVHSKKTGVHIPGKCYYIHSFVFLTFKLGPVSYDIPRDKHSSHQASKESLINSANVLTNPDEELKSVDHQLQQLEQSQSPKAETHQNSPFSSSIKPERTESKQSLPPIVADSSRSPYYDSEDIPKIVLDDARKTYQPITELKQAEPKALENDHPIYQPKVRIESTQLSDSVDEKNLTKDAPPMPDSPPEENDEDIYRKTMLKKPPRNEKWVISSIRRPNQPIKVQSDMVDKSSERNSQIVTPVETDTTPKEAGHVPKAHKPSIPLTIDIPNSVNNLKHPQLAAHQAINDARKHSQMSPVSTDINRFQGNLDEYENMRPGSWQGNTIPQEGQNHYAFPQPERASKSPLGTQFLEEDKNKKKTRPENTGKPAKENKVRFSHFFTGGNKKDKKKEKNQQSAQEQQAIVQQSAKINPVSDIPVYSSQLSSNSRYICYAKAQWPFEATVNGEMSVSQNEMLGIIYKQLDGWWQAERLTNSAAGKKGLVPGNYMVDTSLIQH